MVYNLTATNQSGKDVNVQASDGGIIVTMPVAMMWTAKGYGYQAMAITAVASLVVRPGATAMATLFNNESGGGKHYVIDRAFAHCLVTDVTETYSIWLCSHPVGMTKPTDDITVRNSTSGMAEGRSLAVFDNGATVGDDGWFPWGSHGITPLDGTVPSAHVEAEIGGRIIVPPQGGLSLQVVSSTTTNTFTAGFHWYEVPSSELKVN